MNRASMQKYGQTKHPINLCLPPTSVQRLNQWAQTQSISRSEIIERLTRGLFHPNEEHILTPETEDSTPCRINVTLTPTCIDKLNGWAQDLGTNRSDMLDRLVTGQFRINEKGIPVHHEGQLQLQLITPA